MKSETLTSHTTRTPNDSHIAYAELEAFVENQLPESRRNDLELHLSLCSTCKRDLEELSLFRNGKIVAPRSSLLTRAQLFAGGLVVVVLIIVFGLVNLLTLPAERSPEYAALVNQALAQNFLDIPKDILTLGGSTSTNGTEPSPLRLRSPLSTALLSTKPTFSWEPLNEKAKYSVSVFDEEKNRIDHSGPLAETTWKPSVSLKEGAIYEWQVRAETLNIAAVAPSPSGRRARFRVLTRQEAGPLSRISYQASSDHLMLGVIFARAGLLDDADRELSAGSAEASRLLAYLRTVRR